MDPHPLLAAHSECTIQPFERFITYSKCIHEALGLPPQLTGGGGGKGATRQAGLNEGAGAARGIRLRHSCRGGAASDVTDGNTHDRTQSPPPPILRASRKYASRPSSEPRVAERSALPAVRGPPPALPPATRGSSLGAGLSLSPRRSLCAISNQSAD